MLLKYEIRCEKIQLKSLSGKMKLFFEQINLSQTNAYLIMYKLKNLKFLHHIYIIKRLRIYITE